MKRVGILGGTFDPPHLGHLLIAEEVKEELKLAEIWFIPTYEPPHKSTTKTSVEDRLTMLQKAVASNDSFKISTIEVDRLGKSYTFDTMSMLVTTYPDIMFYFIIGADMVEYLPKWNRIEELVQIVEFIGVGRSGYTLETDYPIRILDIPMIDVSSSLIRDRIREKRSIKYLLPEDVESYTKRKRLYE